MLLTQILQPGCVKVPLQGKTKNAVITELIDLLAAKGLVSDTKLATEAVFNRERDPKHGNRVRYRHPARQMQGRQGAGHGLGIADEPVDFDSVDDKPVKIVILLVSPARSDGSPHPGPGPHQPAHARRALQTGLRASPPRPNRPTPC